MRPILAVTKSEFTITALHDDGSLVMWDYEGAQTDGFSAFKMGSVPGVAKLESGPMQLLIVDSKRRVFGWGDNSDGQLGIDPKKMGRAKHLVPLTDFPPLVDLSLVEDGAEGVGLGVDGQVWSWGAIGRGGGDNDFRPRVVPTDRKIIQITSGTASHAFLDERGQVWFYTRAGIHPNNAGLDFPVGLRFGQIRGLRSWRSGGYYFMLDEDGKVWLESPMEETKSLDLIGRVTEIRCGQDFALFRFEDGDTAIWQSDDQRTRSIHFGDPRFADPLFDSRSGVLPEPGILETLIRAKTAAGLEL